MDVLIEGRALLETELTECCICVEDGKIARIAKSCGRANRKYDFSKLIILPAGVDLHVHFREPGFTHKEDFESGSAAAVCGGVSFVLDMPNTKPATRSFSDLEEKMRAASGKSYADFGLAALLNEGTDFSVMAQLASAFKLYLDDTTGIEGISAEALPALLSGASATRKPVLVHAEHLSPLDKIVERDLADHDRRRPENREFDAAKAVCDARPGDARIHLLHVTQARILDLAGSAGVTAEVTPHHLLLNTDCTLGSLGKINPPLRSESTSRELWNAFSSGRHCTLGSDHSPHTREEKEGDFDSSPSGMPGVETMIPLMLWRVSRRELDLPLLSRSCSTHPAEILGLRKGKIAVGNDADLIVVDLRRLRRISADDLHSKCGWTPYEGMEAVFPVATFVRGEEVARDGELSGERVGRHTLSEEGI